MLDTGYQEAAVVAKNKTLTLIKSWPSSVLSFSMMSKTEDGSGRVTPPSIQSESAAMLLGLKDILPNDPETKRELESR